MHPFLQKIVDLRETCGDNTVLKFDGLNPTRMATITLQKNATTDGSMLRGEAEMY
jgi:hypothetical protein